MTRDDPPRVEEDFSKNFVSVKPQVSEEMRRLMEDNQAQASDFNNSLRSQYVPKHDQKEDWTASLKPLEAFSPDSDPALDISALEKRIAEDSDRRKRRVKPQTMRPKTHPHGKHGQRPPDRLGEKLDQTQKLQEDKVY